MLLQHQILNLFRLVRSIFRSFQSSATYTSMLQIVAFYLFLPNIEVKFSGRKILLFERCFCHGNPEIRFHVHVASILIKLNKQLKYSTFTVSIRYIDSLITLDFSKFHFHSTASYSFSQLANHGTYCNIFVNRKVRVSVSDVGTSCLNIAY
jgi:hypothetical protein